MPVAITYRTPGVWGTGVGRNLTGPEIDQNFYNLATAIVALQGDRPVPNNIASISVSGTVMNITLDSGTVIGPLPLPVLRFNWRGAWAPVTAYAELDTFTVEGFGIYTTAHAHTSGTDFDENIEAAGVPALIKLFGFEAGAVDPIYDMGFYYAGRISDQATGYIYQESMLRGITISSGADLHNAYFQTPPLADISMGVFLNDANVGTLTCSSGQKVGLITLTADLTLARRDRLAVAVPSTADANAAGLSVSFAAQRAV